MRLLVAAAVVWIAISAAADVAATAAMARLMMAVPCMAAEAFAGDGRDPWEMVTDAMRGRSCSPRNHSR